MNTTPDLMTALAWSLVHFLWQGAAIAAVAGVLMYAFRKPAMRYLIGIASLALMLVAFVITFTSLLGAADREVMTAEIPAPTVASLHEVPAEFAFTAAPPAASFQFTWLAQGWLVGVFLLALRILVGLVLIEHLRRRNLVALPESLVMRFSALQARLGIERDIRFSQCSVVGVPAVIGFFRPIVLLPVRALTGLSLEQLEAVVAHELGHIKRFDVLVNFFQVVAETLFFFHPAVWWLNKRIRADREDCCDDIALTTGGSTVGYAKALATIAGWREVPRFAMAANGGPVAARIARLLGLTPSGAEGRAAGMFTASLLLASALIAGAVSLGLSRPAEAQAAISDVGVVAQIATPPVAPRPPAEAPAPAPVVSAAPAASPRPTVAARPAVEAPAVKPAKPAMRAMPEQTRQAPAGRGESFIDAMKSVGIHDVDVDTLISLRVHNVTPEFVREIRVVVPDIQVDEISAMAVHQVTPAYVQELRGMGLTVDADDVIAMKVHGVTPDYVRQMRAAGFEAGTDEIVNMKIHGVTPEYRQLLEAAGLTGDTDDLIEAKIMDITPEFLEKVRAHGFKDLKLSQLIALKHADVL